MRVGDPGLADRICPPRRPGIRSSDLVLWLLDMPAYTPDLDPVLVCGAVHADILVRIFESG
jgi:hypothetical protein